MGLLFDVFFFFFFLIILAILFVILMNQKHQVLKNMKVKSDNKNRDNNKKIINKLNLALYDFTASGDDEISMKTGDVVSFDR